MEKTRVTRYKLDEERFHLGIRRKLVTIIHWNNLPGETVESPSLEVLKMRLDRVLDELF